MLKLQYAVTCVLASALVLPAVTGRTAGDKSLARTLDETVRALEVLAGFQSDAPPLADAVQFVTASTEAPILDGPARDERLMRLRDELNLLAQQYDELAARAPHAPGARAPHTAGAEPARERPITTGLSGVDRRELADVGPARADLEVPPAPRAPSHARVEPGTASVEGPGSSADPVRQARAYYRAGRYAECLKTTEPHAADPEAQYWSACALEKLDRIDEAIARFRAVVGAGNAGAIADRAQQDLEHLEWKRSFRSKLAPSKPSTQETP